MKLLWAPAYKISLCGALLLLGVSLEAAGPPPEKVDPLPQALFKTVPEGIDDLKAIQDQVKAVLKKAMPSTVAIILPDPSGRGVASGSGVIITEDGYVLTAGHISQTPNQKCEIRLQNGKRLAGKTLGWHKRVDAGLIKITDKGPFPAVEMGNSVNLKPGEWCVTVGHPGGFKPGRAPVVRVGRILMNSDNLIRTDTPLVGGDSGGPLFDMRGRVIGIHSWITDQISGNMHVPVNIYRNEWDRLAKGEAWGRGMGGRERPTSPGYLGVAFDRTSEDLVLTEVYRGLPAEKAGLKAGDVIRSIDEQKLTKRNDLMLYLLGKKPGEVVDIEVDRDGTVIQFKVTLTRRPEE